MAGFKQDDDIIASINVTPLVDITLVLLIIFMVTATVVMNPVIPVDLPRAAGVTERVSESIGLVLDRNGRLYMNGRRVSADTALKELRNQVKHIPDIQVLIAADRNVRYQEVVDIINLVNRAGVRNFALNVQETR